MKKLIKHILTAGLFALLLFTFQTCKKDKICCLECDKCENFPKKEGIGVSIITHKPLQKHAPCFNPNNGDEFIYMKEESNKYQLIKYNLQSKSEIILLDNTLIVGQPKWGKNGWIVFSKLDLNVYLMKDNGDSLKQITWYFENNYPSFLGNDKIFISVGAETSPGASGNKIIDYFGNRIDSLKASKYNGVIGLNHIDENNLIASEFGYNTEYGISIMHSDFSNNEFIFKSIFNGRNNIEGIFWHPNNEDVYFSMVREGLFKVNKNSKNLIKVRNGCDSRSYRYLSISPDGQKILVERVDATDFQNKTGSWTEEAKIYIMDIDGKNEKNVFE